MSGFCLTWTTKRKGRDVFSLYPWKENVPETGQLPGIEGVTVLNEASLNFHISEQASPESLRALIEHAAQGTTPQILVNGKIPGAWKDVVSQYA